MKGRCPRPLDDRDTKNGKHQSNSSYCFISIRKLIFLYLQNESKKIVGIPKGIRTPVTAVKGRCPRPLDDRDAKETFQIVLPDESSNDNIGGAMRDRTADLFAASEALSQLSYSPAFIKQHIKQLA